MGKTYEIDKDNETLTIIDTPDVAISTISTYNKTVLEEQIAKIETEMSALEARKNEIEELITKYNELK